MAVYAIIIKEEPTTNQAEYDEYLKIAGANRGDHAIKPLAMYGETVALDLELTPELVRAGLAREVVRLVQEARKSSGLEVSDRISLWWQADGDTAAALVEHAALVADEVLATSMSRGAPGAALAEHGDPGLGLRFWLTRAG